MRRWRSSVVDASGSTMPVDEVLSHFTTVPPPTQRRLTIITPTYHPEPIGTPLYVTDLSRWFDSNGWAVHVVTGQPYYPSFRRHRGYDRRTRNDALGTIRITRLPTIVPSKGRKPFRAVSDVNFLIQGLIRFRRFNETDAVLSVSPGTPWTALLGSVAARTGAPHLALIHDIQSGLAGSQGALSLMLQWGLQRNERWSLNHAEGVAALTKDMKDVLSAIGVDRPMHVVPLWSTVKAPCEFPPLDAEVQYSGNFGEKQGTDRFDELVSKVMARGYAFRLRGDGPRFDALAERLQQMPSELLRLEGLVPPERLTPALARSPIHVVLQAPGTSRYVMPSKIVNALTCGATVIALTDRGSAVERLSTVVEGLHAVPADQLDAAVSKITELMEEARSAARRRAIARRASQHFSKDAVLSQLADLLVGGANR